MQYENAALAGDASDMNNLGYMHEHGMGVNRNKEFAVEWYRKVATAGNV